jgi:aryl-alcohol dehydrogenase-like predicted oxidoreductase
MEMLELTPKLVTSRLGFGCGSLMQVSSRAERQRLLATAFDQGIRHFDVARMYGLGAAEGELGRFVGPRRDEVVIATKFGIEANAASGRLARVQGPLRGLLARHPTLRALVKRHSGAMHQPHRYDAVTARRSLETSLRELGTDHVDILFLHDPAPSDELDLPSVCAYLEEARQAGHIRCWGVAGEYEPCAAIRPLLGEQAVLQVRDDVLGRRKEGLEDPLITFGTIAGVLGELRSRLSTLEAQRRWSAELELDCSQPGTIFELLLREALDFNARGVVLLSSTRVEHLTGLGQLVGAPVEKGVLNGFRRLIAAEIDRVTLT